MRDGHQGTKILITSLIAPLVNGGLLGYGTGEGSCASYPFRCTDQTTFNWTRRPEPFSGRT